MSLPQALEAACLENNVQKVQILLGDFQYQEKIVTSLLHLACEKNLADIIRLIITTTTDVNTVLASTNADNDNPIHIACSHGALESVKVLIEIGHDLPNRLAVCTKSYGAYSSATLATPIHAACKGGNLALVKYLTGFEEVSLMSRCNDGTNCLHLACTADALKVAEYITRKAPSLIHEKTVQGFTALKSCAGFLAYKTIPLMLQLTKPHKEDELFELFLFAMTSSVRDAEIEARCDTMKAILRCVQKDRVRAFVNRPVLGHVARSIDELPVHVAARAASVHALELLVRNGADIGAKNGQGLRPLDICFEYKTMEHHMCVELLVGEWERRRMEAEENMFDLLDEEDEKKPAQKRSKKKKGKKKTKVKAKAKKEKEKNTATEVVQNCSLENIGNDKENGTGAGEEVVSEEPKTTKLITHGKTAQKSSNSLSSADIGLTADHTSTRTLAQRVVDGDWERMNGSNDNAAAGSEAQVEPEQSEVSLQAAGVGHEPVESKDKRSDPSLERDSEEVDASVETQESECTTKAVVQSEDLEHSQNTGVVPVESARPPTNQTEPLRDPTSLDKMIVADYFSSTVDKLHVQALPLGLSVFNVLGEDMENLSAAQLEVLQEMLEKLSKRVLRRQLEMAYANGVEKGQVAAQRAIELFVQDTKAHDDG